MRTRWRWRRRAPRSPTVLAEQGDDSAEVAAVLAAVAMQSDRVIWDVDPDVAP